MKVSLTFFELFVNIWNFKIIEGISSTFCISYFTFMFSYIFRFNVFIFILVSTRIKYFSNYFSFSKILALMHIGFLIMFFVYASTTLIDFYATILIHKNVPNNWCIDDRISKCMRFYYLKSRYKNDSKYNGCTTQYRENCDEKWRNYVS